VVSRRDFLKTSGALIVSFSAVPAGERSAFAQGPFATRPSQIDPTRLDAWLSVANDGSVTAYTGKCELGQGILTAQTQLVAEELSVPFARVHIIQCDTAVTPDQVGKPVHAHQLQRRKPRPRRRDGSPGAARARIDAPERACRPTDDCGRYHQREKRSFEARHLRRPRWKREVSAAARSRGEAEAA